MKIFAYTGLTFESYGFENRALAELRDAGYLPVRVANIDTFRIEQINDDSVSFDPCIVIPDTDAPHPVQPLYFDDRGTLRFRGNAIVNFLLEGGPFNMNKLAMTEFSAEDRQQFAQLIGYSLRGYGELSYVTDEAYERATEQIPPDAKRE